METLKIKVEKQMSLNLTQTQLSLERNIWTFAIQYTNSAMTAQYSAVQFTEKKLSCKLILQCADT